MIARPLQVSALAVLLAGCGTGEHASAQSSTRTMIPYDELTATPAPPATARYSYGRDPLQFGELRLPANVEGKRPVVVLIHGGCWQAEYDLAHTANTAAALAKEGYVVWVPEYRRIGNPGGGWPGTFDDIGHAIDYLRTLGGTVPAIDTTRVILAGHSAGGQLALWAASRRTGPTAGELGGSAPLAVSGVVGLAAISDMATYGATRGGCNAAVQPLLGGTPDKVPDRYRAVSPIERLPIGIPVHLVHGAADPIVPPAMSEQYAAKARAAGDRVQVTIVPGAGHFDVVAPHASAWAAVVAAVRGIVAPQ